MLFCGGQLAPPAWADGKLGTLNGFMLLQLPNIC
jgi:hypothetical protein